MKILGIETSCDETAASIVEDGTRLLSNVVASQEEIHAKYGGIVPEVASRQHLLSMIPVINEALSAASARWDDLDAIAVTHGPGLAGSLLVGVNTAKTLAFATGLPLVPVNHMEGHIYANWLENPPSEFPLVCLLVSGGHTGLFLMKDHGDYTYLGSTRDDAAGEAFDKVARLLGLGFPGGPAIQRVATPNVPSRKKLPRAWLRGNDDFSFSGLKTAVLRMVEDGRLENRDPEEQVRTVATEFQNAVVDVLTTKTVGAAARHGARAILLGGGVAANLFLREVMAQRSPVPVIVASPRLCTDNAAMIAAAGFFRFQAGDRADLSLDVHPALKLA
ncbi:MAG: tRNA (adenosine(37)-N6)-threonylcarbamoyltransferase complex transferase subunit TsaD [Dehalococcoidia bacterium]|nr:tRNA (adenosine(37)-N6)-threonylcarbamoyltransferase complex transferase subunit TsaD [Dehalococcoidia bacterium]